jgi:putative membrane protein
MSLMQSPTRVERRVLVFANLVDLAIYWVIAHDRVTWFLETIWVMLGRAIITWRWPHFTMTRLPCCLLLLHALVLISRWHICQLGSAVLAGK